VTNGGFAGITPAMVRIAEILGGVGQPERQEDVAAARGTRSARKEREPGARPRKGSRR
jgi:hypothetical protein